jgi:hypothetical protein
VDILVNQALYKIIIFLDVLLEASVVDSFSFDEQLEIPPAYSQEAY